MSLTRFLTIIAPVALALIAGCSGADFPDVQPAQAGDRPPTATGENHFSDGTRMAQRPETPAGTAQPPARSGKTSKSDNEEVRSPYFRHLLDMLDKVDGGTAEERRLAHQSILDADEEYFHSSGKNLRQKVLQANNKPTRFRVGAKAKQQHPDREERNKKNDE